MQAADEFRAGLTGEFSSVHGISVNEFLMLLHLQRSPKHRLARVELAKRMHVSASTVTRMAAPMEKIGLLSRDVDERDARIVFVVLTETGAGRLEEALVTFAKRAGYLMDERWQGDDVDQLSEMLRRLAPGAAGTLT
ncbi:MAG: MarR family transcriptional regulator [Shimia sp.]